MHHHQGAPAAPECFQINCISNNPSPDSGAQCLHIFGNNSTNTIAALVSMTIDDDDNDRIAVEGD